MGSAATTRAARTAAGKCAVCLARPASAKHPTCATCRKAIATYGLRAAQARQAGDQTLATAALAELKQRGK